MKKYLSLFLLSTLLFSCTKEGPGGKATIKGMVMHHTKPIPGTVVYIKYGATESPGKSPSNYDANVTADASANYKFESLQKGHYYLYGIGFDSTLSKPVTGGIPIEIKDATGTTTTNVPVTE